MKSLTIQNNQNQITQQPSFEATYKAAQQFMVTDRYDLLNDLIKEFYPEMTEQTFSTIIRLGIAAKLSKIYGSLTAPKIMEWIEDINKYYSEESFVSYDVWHGWDINKKANYVLNRTKTMIKDKYAEYRKSDKKELL